MTEHEELIQAKLALAQLLDEVLEAGYSDASGFNWPKAIGDAMAVLHRQEKKP